MPFEQLPKFYSSWVYWVNPVTWVVRGVMASAIHSVEVECGQTELVTFQPPQGQTCGEYAGEWSRAAFGELLNMDATSDCNYCPFKNGDEYLQTVNIE